MLLIVKANHAPKTPPTIKLSTDHSTGATMGPITMSAVSPAAKPSPLRTKWSGLCKRTQAF